MSAPILVPRGLDRTFRGSPAGRRCRTVSARESALVKSLAESVSYVSSPLAGELLPRLPVSVTSITARIPRVEARLLLHKQMIESLPSAILVCEASTLTVVEHNSAASAFFEKVFAGRPMRSLLGREAKDFFPDFATTLEPLLRRAVETETPCVAEELRLSSARGGERFVAATVQPMTVEDSAMYLMVSLFDVTQKVAAREKQQLLQRMESVGTLAGGLAHDVNNILFAIGGHAYLLRALSSMPADAVAELDQIDVALSRARNLTTKLLTFVRGGSPERHRVSRSKRRSRRTCRRSSPTAAESSRS